MTRGRSNVFILGLGLIGGSVALGLKRAGWPGLVLGHDADRGTTEAALKVGAIDRTVEMTEGCRAADLIYLAVPLTGLPEVLEAVAASLSERVAGTGAQTAASKMPVTTEGAAEPNAGLPVVTDCASAKGWVCDLARRTLPAGIAFVGGHPMAGSEQVGFAAAEAGLLAGCTYALTPDRGARVPQIALDLVSALGARPFITTPAEHDRAVALVSHLPLAVAATLAQSALTRSDGPDLVWELAAGGFRDTTRVASGSPEMAVGICQANKDSLLGALREFRHNLDHLERLIAGTEPAAVLNYFAEAKLRRDAWIHARSGPRASPADDAAAAGASAGAATGAVAEATAGVTLDQANHREGGKE